MKMILFRPTYVAAGMLVLSSLLPSPVSAVPQFGRVHFWALDDVPTSDLGSENGPGGLANPESESTTDASVLAANGSGNTNGASHHLGGVNVPVALVVSAAASAAFFAF